jgi:DNA-binding NtrC family response regulator
MMNMTFLIVDDQASARFVLRRLISPMSGVTIVEADSLDNARQVLETTPIDVALIDIRLGDRQDNRDGLILVKEISSAGLGIPIVVTNFHEMSQIRIAMRNGAYDYLLKDDLCPEMVLPVLERLRECCRLQKEVARLRAKCMDTTFGFSKLIGYAKSMQTLRRLIGRMALTDRSVLIVGESGSGKELVARELHAKGESPDEPFVAINCSALPESLFESLLFGHEKGAFTGAVTDQTGYFSSVGRGTLLLDEVAELPLMLQPKLLRVIETRRYLPLGSTKEHLFKGRFIAATHADLSERVKDGRFREDLFYRLSVLELRVPSLSERRDDIPDLVLHFSQEQHRAMSFTPAALNLLTQLDWPGNVRQLRNVVDRLAILTDDDPIDVDTVEDIVQTNKVDSTETIRIMARNILRTDVPDKLSAIENAIVSLALSENGGNKSAAARQLGIHRKQIERWTRRSHSDTPPPLTDKL